MSGSPVHGYKVGGCAPLVWWILLIVLVAGFVWLTKSLFPVVVTGLILGTRFA